MVGKFKVVLVIGAFVLVSCSSGLLGDFFKENDAGLELFKVYSFTKLEKLLGVKIDLKERNFRAFAEVDSLRYAQVVGKLERVLSDSLSLRFYSRKVQTELDVIKRKYKERVFYHIQLNRRLNE